MLNKIYCILLLLSISIPGFSQVDSFDVFKYQLPGVFTKSELPSRVQLNLTNTNGSFCTITLYKSLPAKENVMKDISGQWNEQVLKRLNKADKKPGRIFTQQLWDGWVSTVALGNFYQQGKKAAVMLCSFKKGPLSACAVYAYSDTSFKAVVEKFSANLHLKK